MMIIGYYLRERMFTFSPQVLLTQTNRLDHPAATSYPYYYHLSRLYPLCTPSQSPQSNVTPAATVGTVQTVNPSFACRQPISDCLRPCCHRIPSALQCQTASFYPLHPLLHHRKCHCFGC
ncbi:hypothetical protein FGO68_gene16694 [Halteria grandinella]|uniref:Uncharacterized protein n=1 Tax=Halteria grandinella TaxID=5974 RepID=A0A8J8NE09_HALGN|nr:hypothetical protein FGO68_gene16694 [Halteria grandinella]